MPENINTTPLGDIERELAAAVDDRPVMVDVDRVSMVFNMASQQLNSLKEYAIALAKRELMFKEFRALDGVSFTVRKGDVFGILGTNGSGKSTMLKIIAGVLEPTEGTCTINGSIAPLIELGAGFDMELTARENIFLNGALLGYSKKFIQQHFDEIVDFAEVEKFLDMPMKNYSSGMVARIAFAIATVIVPEILIVDEVLSVGDFMFPQKCERRITQLIKEHDVTVLIVSHNNDQIERLCNKAIWIEKGHTRMMGSAADVCRAYRVLGGHVGSAESEAAVFSMLRARGTRELRCRREPLRHRCEDRGEVQVHARRQRHPGLGRLQPAVHVRARALRHARRAGAALEERVAARRGRAGDCKPRAASSSWAARTCSLPKWPSRRPTLQATDARSAASIATSRSSLRASSSTSESTRRRKTACLAGANSPSSRTTTAWAT